MIQLELWHLACGAVLAFLVGANVAMWWAGMAFKNIASARKAEHDAYERIICAMTGVDREVDEPMAEYVHRALAEAGQAEQTEVASPPADLAILLAQGQIARGDPRGQA